jgi:hypothetical protein
VLWVVGYMDYFVENVESGFGQIGFFVIWIVGYMDFCVDNEESGLEQNGYTVPHMLLDAGDVVQLQWYKSIYTPLFGLGR